MKAIFTARMVKGLILAASFCVLFTACATTRQYHAMLEQWVGKNATQLTAQWGLPTKITNLADGNEIYEFDFSNHKSYRAIPARALSSSGSIGCRASFIINEDETVVGWAEKGYDCRAE